MNQLAPQRFPITLREVKVVGVEHLSPRMRRILLGGEQSSVFRKDEGGEFDVSIYWTLGEVQETA